MDVISPGYILLAAIALVGWLAGGSANKAVTRAEQQLSNADVETFRKQFLSARSRAEMPTRFADLARARDSASRIWIATMVAIVLVLVWIIAAGPSLGLRPSE